MRNPPREGRVSVGHESVFVCLVCGVLGAALGIAACSNSKEGTSATAGGAAGFGAVAGAPQGDAPNGGVGSGGTPPSAGGIAPNGGAAPAGGTSAGGTSAGGTSAGGTSASGTSASGTSASGTSAGGAAGVSGSGAGGAQAQPEDPMCHTITTNPKFTRTNCNNEADKCYFSSHAAIAYDVGGKCATMTCKQYAIQPETADAKKCFTDCFVQELTTQTGKSVSAACATCSDAVVICGAYNCLSPCIMDPHSADCMTCLCTSHAAQAGNPMGNCLVDAFADCAGFTVSSALVGCPPP